MKLKSLHWFDRQSHRADSNLSVRQMWDREREAARTPAEKAEIDAIFARYI